MFSFGKFYTVAGRAIGFAPEQPLYVVALTCSALRILKWLQYTIASIYFFRVFFVVKEILLKIWFFQNDWF
ncbi:MAG: hypothetical protein LBJ00_13625 [Planctomycetaceae bacterium]|nr:hypothetical protein [Planctomycetaceae bacterium]